MFNMLLQATANAGTVEGLRFTTENLSEALMSDEQIQIRNFYYSDIYEDGLVERVKKANEETIEYNKKQNSIKEAEISGQWVGC